jgi:tetratricopeptide (TPR) repeat protein
MSSVRHRSKAELPPSPLEFAYPLAVPDGTVLGAVILHEVPDIFALHVFQALRLAFAWAAGPDVSGAVFDGSDVEGWEGDVLAAHGVEEALWAPVAVIAGELSRPAEVDPEQLSRACLAVTDWALGCDAHGTAALFAEAAAVVWPNNARLAWICGKIYREQQQFGRAEMWLRRARRVAVWTSDWELQAQAINSLGNIKIQQGDLPAARELLLSAARLAKRKRLRERHAMVLHDLVVVSTYAGRFDEADAYAQQAFSAYGSNHPNLINLSFDVAHLCTQQGQFARALQVLEELRVRFQDHDRQLRVIASIARAAGAAGDVDAFHRAWKESWTLIDGGSADSLRAAAALELGLGAVSLDLREHADHALTFSQATARDVGDKDILTKAQSALDKLDYHAAAAVALRHRRPIPTRAGDLASRYVLSLSAAMRTSGNEN